MSRLGKQTHTQVSTMTSSGIPEVLNHVIAKLLGRVKGRLPQIDPTCFSVPFMSPVDLCILDRLLICHIVLEIKKAPHSNAQYSSYSHLDVGVHPNQNSPWNFVYASEQKVLGLLEFGFRHLTSPNVQGSHLLGPAPIADLAPSTACLEHSPCPSLGSILQGSQYSSLTGTFCPRTISCLRRVSRAFLARVDAWQVALDKRHESEYMTKINDQ